MPDPPPSSPSPAKEDSIAATDRHRDDTADGSDTDREDGFPSPVAPDASVRTVRRRRLSQVRRFVIIGVLVRGVVVAIELGGYYLLGSAALLVDAIASLVDVASSLALLAAIQLAVRPPDDDHPFGHGRYEPLAGLQIGLLIGGAGVVLFVQLLVGESREVFLPRPGAFVIPLVATAALLGTSFTMRAIAGEHRSSALKAEADHYLVDAATSLVAMIALLFGEFLPEHAVAADFAAAALLACMMIGVGFLAAMENLHQLMDRTPDEQYFERVRAAARTVDGVEEVEKIRIQAAGPDAHVDIDIEVDPQMTVEQSHRLAQQVRAAVRTDWPMVLEVVVHVEPFYAGDH